MTSTQDSIVIRRPDDWHLHLRDGDMMRAVLPLSARQFARAIVMPNLVPPITTAAAAGEYRDRILAALPPDSDFEPLMTCYLGDATLPEEVERGFQDGIFTAGKLYPAHATTNSAAGASDVRNIYPVLERMQRLGMPLLIHGEVTDPAVDIFDREAVFIERVLTPLLRDFPELKVVLEHVTTKDAVDFIRAGRQPLAATITAHHLVINRNAIFAGGIRPHMYCLPIAKRERHRLALREAATSGDERFFLGTDSAPHAQSTKESACGCAGIFTAPTAMEIYTQVFDEENRLDRLEAFAALNGPRFYGLPANEGNIRMERRSGAPPEAVRSSAGSVLPFETDSALAWTFGGVVRA